LTGGRTLILRLVIGRRTSGDSLYRTYRVLGATGGLGGLGGLGTTGAFGRLSGFDFAAAARNRTCAHLEPPPLDGRPASREPSLQVVRISRKYQSLVHVCAAGLCAAVTGAP
jgi:hypothetical protein